MSTRPYLGTNVNSSSAEEIRFRGILDEDETLLGLFDGILLDERGRRIGGLALSDFVVLTERRLILWARGFFNDTVDAFDWKDVDVAHHETWDPYHGRVRFAIRLPPVAPRPRRIALKGNAAVEEGSDERVIINTLDYVPGDDVPVLVKMVAWIGDQVVQGVSIEQLLPAFGEMFPMPEERPAPAPFFASPPAAPPPPEPPPTAPAARKRWWQFGKGEEETPPPQLADNPSNLISAYESRRNPNDPATRTPNLPPAMPNGAGLPEQPSMYDVSRSLRLMLEAPRRLAGALRRANEMVSGTSELVGNMRDPRVRRNALAGMRSAVEDQEAKNGPLAPIGPLARAVIAFSEPLEEPKSAPAQDSRRIQVRPAQRQRPEAAPPPAAPEPPFVEQPAAEARPNTGMRRSITVRRNEPAAPPEPPPAPSKQAFDDEIPDHEGAVISTRANVRRIVISRGDD